MAGPVLVATSVVQCQHGGNVQLVLVNPRVKFGGGGAVKPGKHPITGCQFAIAGQASPCVQVVWGGASVRVNASGQALIVDPGAGVCVGASGLPQGSPVVVVPGQTRVLAD